MRNHAVPNSAGHYCLCLMSLGLATHDYPNDTISYTQLHGTILIQSSNSLVYTLAVEIRVSCHILFSADVY